MEIVASALTTIMIAAVSSWITVQLSLRRFRTEKWWERRVAAYERLIEVLHHSKAFFERHLKASSRGLGDFRRARQGTSSKSQGGWSGNRQGRRPRRISARSRSTRSPEKIQEGRRLCIRYY